MKRQAKNRQYELQRRRLVYAPGNIVHDGYWNQDNLVLTYHEDGDGTWSVTVQCLRDGQIRTHSTEPGRNDRVINTL